MNLIISKIGLEISSIGSKSTEPKNTENIKFSVQNSEHNDFFLTDNIRILICDTMKILQIVPFFSSNHGGSAVVPYELSKSFQKRGHEVTVLTTDFQLKNDFINSLEGVEVIPFHCQMNIGGLLISPSMNKYLKKNIKKFDIIHMHNFRTFQNIIVHYYVKKYGIPYVVQPHGSLPRIIAKQRLKKLYDMLWGNNILLNAEGVIALTSIEAGQAIKMGVEKNRVHIIANGLDLSQYENFPTQGIFRSLYNIPSSANLILYLGRLHPIKGVNLLIRAFDVVSKEISNCFLVIAGPDDGSLSELKLLTKELHLCNEVLFTGPLYGTNKSSAYCDSDIYVLPSYYETFPMTVLEAWAFKKPVIVTENCGIKGLVQDSGQVIKPDSHSLATAIKEYLQQDYLRHCHGQNGYNKLHDGLSIQATAENVENLYQKVMKSRDFRSL